MSDRLFPGVSCGMTGLQDGSASPLISVVIPVYNVADYLEECLDGIVSQTYGNVEVILVDDGSTDESAQICDVRCAADPRMRAVHIDNQGPGGARNIGLELARGAYVAFVDGDDVVSPRFIEALVEVALKSGSKIVVFEEKASFQDGAAPQFQENPEGGESGCVTEETLDVQAYLERVLYQRVPNTVFSGLYQRDVLGCAPFPPYCYGEDLIGLCVFAQRAQEVTLVHGLRLYGYRLRRTGLTCQHYTRAKADSALAVSRQIRRDVETWYPGLLREAISSRCFSINRAVFAQTLACVHTSTEAAEDSLRLWRELGLYKGRVLRDGNARKRERVAAFVACLGRLPFAVFCRACSKAGLLR